MRCRMKTRRLLVPTLALATAILAITTPASAEKLVVFKNGKVMLAKSVTEEAEWLKCEFDGGNFMSIPRARVSAIEESTLPESASRNTPANQLIDGPRGNANIPSGGGSGVDDVPRAGRGAVQAEPQMDDQEEMRRAIAEEAEARRGTFGGRNRPGQQQQPNNGLPQHPGLQQQQQFQGQPVPGLNQAIPGMQPITTPSSNIGGKKRTIGRRSDRGMVTQQPGQEQNQNE